MKIPWTRRLINFCIFAAFASFWWFVVVQFALQNRSDPDNHPTIVFSALVAISTPVHAYALYRFHKMFKVVEKAEELGLAESGSGLFAENQRFRYFVRTLESCYLIIISALAYYAAAHPEFLANRTYGKVVLTYFFGSIVATTYLTWRDLRVLTLLKKIDHDSASARLVSVHDAERSPGGDN